MEGKIWCDDHYIYMQNEDGKVLKQSLNWYPRLKKASPEKRADYTLSPMGIHWESIDEDISFESFEYPQ